MTNAAYETMKLIAVTCACGYFIGTSLGIIIIGIMQLISWIKLKHTKKQPQE